MDGGKKNLSNIDELMKGEKGILMKEGFKKEWNIIQHQAWMDKIVGLGKIEFGKFQGW